jgi:hypothetical protein
LSDVADRQVSFAAPSVGVTLTQISRVAEYPTLRVPEPDFALDCTAPRTETL